MLKYLIFSYDGAIFPLADRLLSEGATVWVCQVEKGKDLGTKSWVNDGEDKETEERRMSLYDGILNKHGLKDTRQFMEGIRNKDEWFVIVDHNALYPLGEECLEAGFEKGLMPTEEDFNREKERQKAKEFVKEHYKDPIVVDDVVEIKGVDKGIEFVRNSDMAWCVKSDGNFAETVVPDKDDLAAAKEEVVAELERQREGFEKGGMLFEPKVMGAAELAPEMVFWNGEPVYSEVEFETRMLGCEDIGPQTGGNENLVCRTRLDCALNRIAFPQAARDLAKGRKGMFILDAGLMFDGELFHFTEFAGNRWGWGGVFSEMAGAGKATDYFEKVAKGESPQKYRYGVSVAFYNMKEDEEGTLPKGDLPILIEDGYRPCFDLMQVKAAEMVDGKEKGEGAELVNVGYRSYESGPLGYVVNGGDTVEEAVGGAYDYLAKLSFKGVYFRPYSDFMSKGYVSSIPRRYEATKEYFEDARGPKPLFSVKRPKQASILS